MSNQTIPGLPIAAPLTGDEEIWVVQNGIDVRTTTGAIAGILTMPVIGQFFSGQQTSTNVAEPLPSQAVYNSITVAAEQFNSAPIYIGPMGVSIATGDQLPAGETRTYQVSNAALIYIISAANSGDKVTFSGN